MILIYLQKSHRLPEHVRHEEPGGGSRLRARVRGGRSQGLLQARARVRLRRSFPHLRQRPPHPAVSLLL